MSNVNSAEYTICHYTVYCVHTLEQKNYSSIKDVFSLFFYFVFIYYSNVQTKYIFSFLLLISWDRFHSSVILEVDVASSMISV